MPRLYCSRIAFILTALLTLGSAAVASDTPARQITKLLLHDNWQLQSSCLVHQEGGQISTAGFAANGWHRAQVPGTVVGSLVADKTYPDPTFGTNLRLFPGMDYRSAAIFANQDMPQNSPFRCSWWYRTEFVVSAAFARKTIWLRFLGINYRANIWVNGQNIAGRDELAGAYRAFEFNVSKVLRPGKTNALAVEIFAPEKNDLGLTWVDWNPTPADKSMGIWREVVLSSTGKVSIRKPFVASRLDSEQKDAQLTISAELRNASDQPVNGILHAEVDSVKISQPVRLAAGETRIIHISPDQFPQMRLKKPRLWWPYPMGTPNLYTARLSFDMGSHVSDSTTLQFGIREVTSELTDKGYRLFRINGRRILIRGAAWAPDLFLRWSSERLDADLSYVRDMGLNAIRLEGRLDRDEFFEKTDRMGILVMPGWVCCDAWERWKNWTDETKKIAAASLMDQIGRLRNHPSVFVWLNGSDNPPPAAIEDMYLGILRDLEWPNPSLSSASAAMTSVSGKSGVKMTGPYEYVPPVYWLSDIEAGGAYGFNTETSPGPAIPTLESLKRFLPADHLWPIDDVWNYHAGGGRFTNVNIFTDGLNRRYGQATSLEDYVRKAQAMAYDGQRAMFEAYARNKYASTGVIQWMLNNAWPSLIWHLYDYYQVPAGGYYGTKKACEPVHVQYSYDDDSVAVINETDQSLRGMRVSAKLYNIDTMEKASREATLDLAPDSSAKAFDLSRPGDLSATYFLRLKLNDREGKLISENFYWLSTKPDKLDWSKRKDTAYTPQSEFGDLTGLDSLPPVRVAVTKSNFKRDGKSGLHVLVENRGAAVAFMVHLRLTRGQGGEDLTPVFWSDNYFSLLPGEKREVEATYDLSALNGKPVELEIDGWNVAH